MKDYAFRVSQRVDGGDVRLACRQQEADEGGDAFSQAVARFGLRHASVFGVFALQPATRQMHSATKANRLGSPARRTRFCSLCDGQAIWANGELHGKNCRPFSQKATTIGTFLTKKPCYPLEIARLSRIVV